MSQEMIDKALTRATDTKACVIGDGVLAHTAAIFKKQFPGAGRAIVIRRSEYIHTGWRKIQGKWAYLHAGGAIGADNVNTALEGTLSLYNLESEAPILEGFRASRRLTEVMSQHLAVPLLAAMYLAPLRGFLKAAGVPPGFALFLVGKGGGRKSTAAALALSHFGNFSAKTPVASFHDTANSVRRKAFCLQDIQATSVGWLDGKNP